MSDIEPAGCPPAQALSDTQKRDLLHRLARVEGQLRGVQKLIHKAEAAGDCEAIAQQMSAARKALDKSFVILLAHSLQTHTGAAKNLAEAADASSRIAELLVKFI